MVFSCQPSQRGAAVLLACPDTDLMSFSISQETQRPPCNNSIEERTGNKLVVSYCKKSLLFLLLSWEAWKTATCTAGSSKQPQGKQHECARCLQSHKHQRISSEDLIKHFSTISPDSFSSCQHTTFTWSLNSLNVSFFHRKFYRLQDGFVCFCASFLLCTCLFL